MADFSSFDASFTPPAERDETAPAHDEARSETGPPPPPLTVTPVGALYPLGPEVSALLSELTGPVGERYELAPPKKTRSPFRRMLIAAAAMALLIASGVGLLLLPGKSNADAAVALAVTSSINDRTAEFSVSGSVSEAGDTIPIVGFGRTDFTQNALQMLLNVGSSGGGDQVTENALYLDKVMYLNLGALTSKILPGKSWLSLDLSQAGGGSSSTSKLGVGGSTLGNDPVTLLKILGQNGNDATDLGPSTINGDKVEGYAVTVNEAAIRAEMAHENLPSWMRSAVDAVSSPHLSYKVYVNAAGLLDRTTTNMALKVDGKKLTESVSMDFSKYGIPVSITAPPADQVASFQDFIQTADALASSSLS